jgi:hypothetical protein
VTKADALSHLMDAASKRWTLDPNGLPVRAASYDYWHSWMVHHADECVLNDDGDGTTWRCVTAFVGANPPVWSPICRGPEGRKYLWHTTVFHWKPERRQPWRPDIICFAIASDAAGAAECHAIALAFCRQAYQGVENAIAAVKKAIGEGVRGKEERRDP